MIKFLIFFCAFSYADVLSDLDNFYKQKPEKKETAVGIISSIGTNVDAPTKEDDTRTASLTSTAEPTDTFLPTAVSFPLAFNYKPLASHSVYIIKTPELVYGIEYSLYLDRLKKFKFLYDKIKPIISLDPVVQLGVLKKTDLYYYFNVIVSFSKFTVKLNVHSKDYKDLLNSSKGKLAVYYKHKLDVNFMSNDYIVFYGGYVSPPLSVNLDDLESFKNNFKDFNKNHLQGGVYYAPNIFKNYSFNLEGGMNFLYLGYNLLF